MISYHIGAAKENDKSAGMNIRGGWNKTSVSSILSYLQVILRYLTRISIPEMTSKIANIFGDNNSVIVSIEMLLIKIMKNTV